MTDTLSGVRERAQSPFSFHQHLPPIAATVLVLVSAGLGAYAGWEFGKAGGLILAIGLAVAAVAGEVLKPFAVAGSLEAASRLQPIRFLGCLAVDWYAWPTASLGTFSSPRWLARTSLRSELQKGERRWTPARIGIAR